MKTYKPILLVLLAAATFTACRPYLCGLALATNDLPDLESKVLTLSSRGKSDTTLVFISGEVWGKYLQGYTTFTEKLGLTNLAFVNRMTADTVVCWADAEGKFQRYLPEGIYTISLNLVGYNDLIIEHVDLGAGELKELDALLGPGHGKTFVDGRIIPDEN